MSKIDFGQFQSLKNSKRYEAVVFHKLLAEGYREYDKDEEEVLMEYGAELLRRAVADNDVAHIEEAFDQFNIAKDLTSRDEERVQRARDRIIARKQSTGELLAYEEQQRVKQAQHDASPLKPLEDLITWIKQQWEEWIYPTLKAVKQMFDALWPLIRDTLEDLPRSLDIIRKDLIVPYLKACENWKDYVDKLSNDLRNGEKAAALDMNGMPAIIPPNLDPEEATHLKSAFNLPLVRPMALGCLAPLQMLEYQANIKRGFYGPVQYYSWLLRNDVGPDIGGMVSDLLGVGRRVGRAVGGAGDALGGAGDVLGDIPDWFFSHTVPKFDIATGKTDYYLY